MTTRPSSGDRDLRMGRGPFATVTPALLIAACWLAAAAVWGVAGTLPGGQWTVVHLFTLGVLTTVLVAFTQHFARSLTRHDAALGWWHLMTLTVGVGGTLVGMVTGTRVLLLLGAMTVTGIVALARVRLTLMRRGARAPRFVWVVTAYERAHEAFLVAAVLGAAMGAGLVSGGWYDSVRLAHLHLNVLGWAGLVVLPTAVFFGAALLRVRLPADAERRARRALAVGAPALLAAGVLMAIPASPGPWEVLVRGGTGTALAVFAWPVLSVTRIAVEMARSAPPGATRFLLPAAMTWLSVGVVADIAVVIVGEQQLLPALGLAIGLGGFLQLMLAVVLYLVPSLRGRGLAARNALIARTQAAATIRAIVYNGAVLILVIAALGVGVPAVSAVAWNALLAVIASTGLLAVWPGRDDKPRSHRSERARGDAGREAPV